MKSENLWATALVGVTVLWGWSFVAIHESLEVLSASAFNACRFLIGATVMLIVLLRRRRQIVWREARRGLLPGLVLFLAFALQTVGIAFTTASNASFITGLAVIFAPLFAYWMLQIRPNRQQIASAIVAAIGLALLTVQDLSVHIGDLLVLGCAVFTALHIVVLSKQSKGADVELLAFVQVLIVGLLSLTWSVVCREFSVPHTPQPIWTVVIVGIGGTAVGYFVQTKAQVESSPSRIALILVLEPVFGGLFGYFIGGDRLNSVNLVGAMLIVISMIIAEFRPRLRIAPH
ncbi:DMT family transporter [Paraburkholderia silviterrae]|uniref:DMT family transporter n=1 Tax=Paraburkholderia silviterrae TaxID=2528715 RepID=A0A4V2ZYG8_9BURK|nr:DMT family transporter [Paraburkholderia silviterrae]TDG20219.1 DMT family transporter [Paraburkholderia silviterrae]